MKKIYFIIILGIFLVGTLTASILITSREKISEVNTISNNLICNELQKNDIESYNKYCGRKVINLDIVNSALDINLVRLNNDKVFYEVKAK